MHPLFHRILLACVLASLLGAGCLPPKTTDSKSSQTNDPRPAWRIPRQGIAIMSQAESDTGPDVRVTDAGTGRAFITQLPSIFTDRNGVYTTSNAQESVRVQLAVQGTPESDRMLFGQQSGLSRFEDTTVGTWRVTVAYQDNVKRWVVRATTSDPYAPPTMYHVIECLSSESTDNLFWNGCRGIIEHARIEQSLAPLSQ